MHAYDAAVFPDLNNDCMGSVGLHCHGRHWSWIFCHTTKNIQPSRHKQQVYSSKMILSILRVCVLALSLHTADSIASVASDANDTPGKRFFPVLFSQFCQLSPLINRKTLYLSSINSDASNLVWREGPEKISKGSPLYLPFLKKFPKGPPSAYLFWTISKGSPLCLHFLKKFPKGPPFAYVFWKNFQRVPSLLTFFEKKFKKNQRGEYWLFLLPWFEGGGMAPWPPPLVKCATEYRRIHTFRDLFHFQLFVSIAKHPGWCYFKFMNQKSGYC